MKNLIAISLIMVSCNSFAADLLVPKPGTTEQKCLDAVQREKDKSDALFNRQALVDRQKYTLEFWKKYTSVFQVAKTVVENTQSAIDFNEKVTATHKVKEALDAAISAREKACAGITN